MALVRLQKLVAPISAGGLDELLTVVFFWSLDGRPMTQRLTDEDEVQESRWGKTAASVSCRYSDLEMFLSIPVEEVLDGFVVVEVRLLDPERSLSKILYHGQLILLGLQKGVTQNRTLMLSSPSGFVKLTLQVTSMNCDIRAHLDELARFGITEPQKLLTGLVEEQERAAYDRAIAALPVKCKFDLEVLRGRNLPVGDLNGFSDPYLKLSIVNDSEEGKFNKKGFRGRNYMQTSFRVKTLNPVWNEHCEFSISIDPKVPKQLLIECWDHDFGSKDDFLAKAVVPLDEIMPTGTKITVKLEPAGEVDILLTAANFSLPRKPQPIAWPSREQVQAARRAPVASSPYEEYIRHQIYIMSEQIENTEIF